MVSKYIIFMVIQMISSDFRKFIKVSGINDLCKLRKYQDFMNYLNYGKVEISKHIKVFAAFLDLLINQIFL